MRRILPSITTHGLTGSSWQDKIREIAPLNLDEVALFVTKLDLPRRKLCYRMLEEVQKLHYFTVPFVHAVSSMADDEFQYLRRRFGTERFNLHTVSSYPLEYELSNETRERIFIENTSIVVPLVIEDLYGFGGICFDLSHLEDARRNSPGCYDEMVSLSRHVRVGANHISAVGDAPKSTVDGIRHYSTHVAEGPGQFQYLTGLPAHTFSDLWAVELENSLAEQLHLIDSFPEHRTSQIAIREGGQLLHP